VGGASNLLSRSFGTLFANCHHHLHLYVLTGNSGSMSPEE
jgi:hypothetical protein